MDFSMENAPLDPPTICIVSLFTCAVTVSGPMSSVNDT